MEHGTVNEINQIATMCGVVMSFIFPDLVFYEEGFYETGQILVSPDGSLRTCGDCERKIFAFEGKTPIGNEFKPILLYSVPERYVPQTLFEQKALQASQGTI